MIRRLSQYRSSRSDSAAADLAAFDSDFVRRDASILRFDSLGCLSTNHYNTNTPMLAQHVQCLSWLILERLNLCLSEVLRCLNRQHLTDVQTDVHIVPVDSDSVIRNLLKLRTVRCALVPYKGN